jgi:hypothetical protein
VSEGTDEIRVESFALAAVHLTRRPFMLAYRRYYDFLGKVIGFEGDLVRVQVYGVAQTEASDWWALVEKPGVWWPTTRVVSLP